MTIQPPGTMLFDRNLVLQREYWRTQLRDADCAAGIPPDFTHPATYDGVMREIPFSLPETLSVRVTDLARGNDLLLYTIIVGCCKVLIHIYSEATHIAVGSPARGGTHPNGLPMISHIGSQMLMRDILAAELEVLREGYKHQDWPYERMLKEIGIDTALPKCCLFDIAIILTNLHGPLPDLRNDITVSLTRGRNTLLGSISYRPSVYEKKTIERFGDYLCRTIAWAVEDPGRQVSDLALIDADEQQQIITGFNNTVQQYPDDVCFHTLFEEQVARTPLAPALMTRKTTLTYHELNQRVNILADHLLRSGMSRGQIVGIYYDRTPEGITAILAVLKAGGIYLPLDPDYPDERIAFMVRDAGVSLILTDKERAGWLQELQNVTTIRTDTFMEKGGAASKENPEVKVGPEDIAYLIYTSGSTGIPKGALIAHRGLCNLTKAHIDAFEVKSQSRVLQFSSWSFDAMVSELAMSLGCGACLCLCPSDSMIPGPPLVEVINKFKATHITLPPAALQYLEPADMPSLTHIITAGDFCPPEQVRRWAASRTFYNAYGVTEATVCSTIAPVSADKEVRGVGRPMANATVYILDSQKRMMPVGIPGELYLGGVGVAQGYLNRKELTDERFLPDPFTTSAGARMYKSGDRGRFLDDGSIELIGRIDHQVKIRGFRIEPGEIEHVLELAPAVKRAMILPCREDTSLAAFIESSENAPDVAALMAHCHKYLPHFMVPAVWHILDTFPLNPNGKIDRKALVALADADRERARECANPRSSLEVQLVSIWQEILEIDSVGIREDFFAIGGHSLLAIRLLALIQQRMSVKMSFADLIEHPTIEQLALCIHQNANGILPFSHLVPIQPKGEQRPLFCIHPGGGNVQGYLELSRLLGENQPLYGIQASGFESGQEVIEDIHTMAIRYVEAMQSVQDHGPYAIIGWCFGARAAFECAQLLVDRGERVEYLAFLDAYAPHVIPDSLQKSDDATLWESLLAQDTPITAEELRMFSPEKQRARVIQMAREADLIPGYFSDDQAQNVLNVFRANSRIVQAPVRESYSGQLELFKAEEEAETAQLFTTDPSLGWQDVVTGPVSITVVPGNHNTLVRHPYVRTLANLIEKSLKIARDASLAICTLVLLNVFLLPAFSEMVYAADADLSDVAGPEKLLSVYRQAAVDDPDGYVQQSKKYGSIGLLKAVHVSLEKSLTLNIQEETVNVARGQYQSQGGLFDYTVAVNGSYGLNSTKVDSVLQQSVPFDVIDDNSATTSVTLSKKLRTGPTVSFSSDLTQTDYADTLQATYAGTADPKTTATVKLSVTIPLLKGVGRYASSSETAAKYSYEASRFDYVQAIFQNTLSMVEKYWDYKTAYSAYAVNLSMESFINRLLEQEQSAADGSGSEGTNTERDIIVSTLRAKLADASRDSSEARQNITSTRQAFGLELGLDATDLDELPVPADEFNLNEVALKMEEAAYLDYLTELAVKHRPDLKSLNLQVRSSNVLVDQAENNLQPQVDLVGSAGYVGLSEESGVDGFSSSFTDSEDGELWLVGVTCSYPFGNHAAKGALLSQSSSQRINIIKRNDLIRQISSQLTVDIASLKQQISSLKQSEISVQRYWQSILSSLKPRIESNAELVDLLDLQEKLREAELDRLTSLNALAQAIASTRFHSGTLVVYGDDKTTINLEHLTTLP